MLCRMSFERILESVGIRFYAPDVASNGHLIPVFTFLLAIILSITRRMITTTTRLLTLSFRQTICKA
ncbi:hypothetical protein AQUCO_02500232v1 [Aquilegia coerulea]|uniref:Uncharacterized protein n=1 Tax=Aquilegia coerulea TaxID=218851 RepID=A0A2G5DA56_AQUCA|nr:hypothetical protein AQUCO_02500232v1 [Aquilegia coerulea]